MMKWRVISCELVGKENRNKEIGCQKGRLYRTEDGTQVICLVDMESRTEHTSFYSGETARMIAEFMMLNQRMILAADEETIEYKLSICMDQWVEKNSKKYNVSKDDLSASVLAVMVHADSKSYCLIHLGQGAAVVWSGERQVYLLSEKGRRQTVHIGKLNNIKGFLLVSKEIYDGYEDLESLEDIFRRRNSYDILNTGKEKDQSMMLILRN